MKIKNKYTVKENAMACNVTQRILPLFTINIYHFISSFAHNIYIFYSSDAVMYIININK